MARDDILQRIVAESKDYPRGSARMEDQGMLGTIVNLESDIAFLVDYIAHRNAERDALRMSRKLWAAILQRRDHWKAKAKETANKHDADYALGIVAGLGMALVMVRRVRDGEPPNEDLQVEGGA